VGPASLLSCGIHAAFAINPWQPGRATGRWSRVRAGAWLPHAVLLAGEIEAAPAPAGLYPRRDQQPPGLLRRRAIA